MTPIVRIDTWIDSVTGSVVSHKCILGLQISEEWERSALDKWATDQGILLIRRWIRTRGDLANVVGHVLMRSHEQAPPIYAVRGYALERLVSEQSDEQLRRFLSEMNNSSAEAQERAIHQFLALE